MMLTIEERWHWWRSLGSPRYVCAPMVLQSELAFRMLIRRHGTTLCYAPMLPAAAFLSAPTDGSEQNANTGGPATQAACIFGMLAVYGLACFAANMRIEPATK